MAIFYRSFAYLGIPAPVPGGIIYITEIVLFFLLIGNLHRFLAFKWIDGWNSSKSKDVFIPYILFFVLSSLALILGDWNLPGMVIREFASFYYSLFFFIPVILVRNSKQIDKLLHVIILGAAFASILIVIRVIMGYGGMTSTGMMRYGNHETVGYIIVISWMMIKPFKKWKMDYWIGFIIIVGIIMFFIAHRSAIIALVVTISLMSYLCRDRLLVNIIKNSIIVFFFSLSMTILMLILNSDLLISFIDRLITIFIPSQEVNASWRLLSWWILLTDMNSYDWIIGKGWGFQIPVFEFGDRVYGAKNEIRGIHNSLLFYLYHIGFIGVIGFLLFVKNVYKRAKLHFYLIPIQIQRKINAMFSACIGILVFSMFNVVFEGPYMSFFFWLLLGMIFSLTSITIRQYKVS